MKKNILLKLSIFYSHFSTILRSNEIPTIDAFIHWTDSVQLRKLKTTYYEKLSLQKTWNPKTEILRFAYQNVFIVLWTCLNFIKESFNFQAKLFEDKPTQLFLHPFSHHCSTISSYSYKLLILSSLNDISLYSTNNDFTSYSDRVSRPELEFCEFMSWKFPEFEFVHAFNSVTGQKKIGVYSIDLYSPISKEAYFFQGCWTHTHTAPECKEKKRLLITKENATCLNSLRNYAEARERDNYLINLLLNQSDGQVTSVKFFYECEWQIFKKTDEYKNFAKSNENLLSRPLYRLEPSVANRGGLLDVYNLHWSSQIKPEENFEFLDLNSIYSYIAITHKYPFGKPKVLVGKELNQISIKSDGIYYNNQLVENGFIFCQILAPSDLEVPFLQYRVKSKRNQHVVLAVCKKCAEEKKVKCYHRCLKSKAFTTTYTVPEVNFSIKHLKYTVTSIYEMHIFLDSDFILKDFFSKMASLRLKNLYDGLISKDDYCNQVNSLLDLPENFKLTPTTLCNNVTKQSIIKLSLNSVIGKFSANQNHFRQNFIVNSQKQLEEKTRLKKIYALEPLNDYSVLVTIDSPPRHSSRNVNIYIGSHISAFARIYLYQKIMTLLKEKCTLYYQDTDSLAFSKPKHCPSIFQLSPLLGDFKQVLGPQSIITEFYSLGQRNYCIVFENQKNEIEFLVKCKGLCLKNWFSKDILSPNIYHSFISKFLSNEIQSLNIKQMRLKQKSQVTPKIMLNQTYSFSNQIHINRIILKSGSTLPYGYKVK